MIAAVRRTGYGRLALVPIRQRISRIALGQANDTTPVMTPAQAWTELNKNCVDMLKSEEACRGLLGTKEIYFPIEKRPSIPWWAYLVLGIGAGFAIANLVGEGT